MAKAKGLHVHPIKEGVFSIITKGFATDAQIFGKPSYRYIKTRLNSPFRSLDTDEIQKGIYLVLEKVDIFGLEPTYQITEYNNNGEIVTTYNIYKQS